MKRRDFIALLGGAAAWPLAARAQQPAMPVVGLLYSQSPDTFADLRGFFRQGLKEAGFIEGENVAIEYRWPENQTDRLPALAADLARQRVAVLATVGNEAAQAAKAGATTVPIAFAVGEDPVRLGLVASLARPGGNLTGINFFVGELAAKRLELLRELVPGAVRVAVLVNPANPNAKTILSDVEAAARAMGLQIQVHNSGTIDPWTLRSALLALLLVILPERPEAQMKSVAVGGTELAYLDMGQGSPVVMVHGTISDHRWWKAQMDEFSQRHRVIAYSLRHHYPNVSIGDRSDYLPRTHAADLAGLIQALNLARAHLLGHSYGGFISLLVARDRPELVRSLVLVEPARLAGLITGADAEEAKPILKGIGESQKQVLELLDQGDADEALRVFTNMVRGPGTWEGMPNAARAARRDNVHTLKPTLANPAERFTCDDAGKIATPTLLVGGDVSPRIFPLMLNGLQPCLTRAERITIAKASHGVYQDNPADFNGEVLAFLERQ